MSIEDTHFFGSVQTILQERINDAVKRKLENFKIQLSNVLTNKELEYINVNRIVDSTKTYIEINLRPCHVKKDRTKKVISEDKRCMARIGSGGQCTRSKLDDIDFCKSHQKKLPYGHIDGPLDENFTKLTVPSSRGRNKPLGKKYTLDDLDINKYLQAIVITIDGKLYLHDEHGMLYNYDDKVQIIGRVTEDRIEWY